jgi:hypothetical protein
MALISRIFCLVVCDFVLSEKLTIYALALTLAADTRDISFSEIAFRFRGGQKKSLKYLIMLRSVVKGSSELCSLFPKGLGSFRGARAALLCT